MATSVSAEQARETVRAIFDSPVNFLDTSRNYGFGRSEERIGEVIRERGGLPKGFVISSKLDRDMETNKFDGARARRSLEESLKTLNVDHIQLLHVHDPEYASSLSDVTGPKGALAELFRMKEEGLAHAVGLAAGRVDIMMPLLRDWDFDALITHNRFTLVNRNAEAMMDYAREPGASPSSMLRPIAAVSLPRARHRTSAMSIRKHPPKCWRQSPGSSRSAPGTAFRPAPRPCSSPCAIHG